MKKKNILFILSLFMVLAMAIPNRVHAAESSSKNDLKAYQTFLKQKIGKKKYFQIVSIGEKKQPVLIVGRGKPEVDSDKNKHFTDCDVYYASQGKVKKLVSFKDYGSRWINLQQKKNNYYIENGLSDVVVFYRVQKGKAKIWEYYNCHSGKKEDNWAKSKITLDGKNVKNLGYLKNAQYEKKRDSFKYVETSIAFQKNTELNRKQIVGN